MKISEKTMTSFLPLLSIFLLSAKLIHGQNFSPLDHLVSPDQQNEVTPIIQTKPFPHVGERSGVNQQRPQVQQPVGSVASTVKLDKKSDFSQLAPVQPSSDLLPPEDIIENTDYEGFSNVKTKPLPKLKRDNEGQAEAQEVSPRFLIPGGGANWGWTGSQGGIVACTSSCYPYSNLYDDYANSYAKKCCSAGYLNCCGQQTNSYSDSYFRSNYPLWTGNNNIGYSSHWGNNNYQKPGSCYRGGYNSNNNIYNSYARSYRVKRQSFTPYYGGNNNGGFGSSGGYYYPGNNNNNNGYYPSGPIHGGNGGYNPGGPIHGGNGGGNGISYCYRDNDCPGNKKCCDGYCRTPAYVG